MALRENMPPSRYGMAVPMLFILTGFLVTFTILFALIGEWVGAIVCGVTTMLLAGAAAWRMKKIEREPWRTAPDVDTVETGMAPPTPYGDLGHEPDLEEAEEEVQTPPYSREQHP
jgi:hypothetical protein